MDCREIKLSIDSLLDGELDTSAQAMIGRHLAECRGCRAAVAGAQALRDALAALPVPPPSTDFHERVICNTVRRAGGPSRHALFSMALAATLALGIGIGVLLAPATSTRTGQPIAQAALQHVALVHAVAKDVYLAFESAQSLQGVTLTVRLPDQVELVGYPGQRELSWRTDLAAGVNALTLPLVMTGGNGGELIAELGRGTQRKSFRLMIEAYPAKDAAVDAPHAII
jgi:anti-sigma factor RsiW